MKAKVHLLYRNEQAQGHLLLCYLVAADLADSSSRFLLVELLNFCQGQYCYRAEESKHKTKPNPQEKSTLLSPVYVYFEPRN